MTTQLKKFKLETKRVFFYLMTKQLKLETKRVFFSIMSKQFKKSYLEINHALFKLITK